MKLVPQIKVEQEFVAYGNRSRVRIVNNGGALRLRTGRTIFHKFNFVDSERFIIRGSGGTYYEVLEPNDYLIAARKEQLREI